MIELGAESESTFKPNIPLLHTVPCYIVHIVPCSPDQQQKPYTCLRTLQSLSMFETYEIMQMMDRVQKGMFVFFFLSFLSFFLFHTIPEPGTSIKIASWESLNRQNEIFLYLMCH